MGRNGFPILRQRVYPKVLIRLSGHGLEWYDDSEYLRILLVLLKSNMEREEFEALVARAIENLPLEFRERLENVGVVVEQWPTPEQLRQAKARSRRQLFGLYQGVPQTRRGRGYGLVLPDKISIFQGPVEAQCRFDGEVEATVGEVVRHEIAHHFGLDERTLREIDKEKYRRR